MIEEAIRCKLLPFTLTGLYIGPSHMFTLTTSVLTYQYTRLIHLNCQLSLPVTIKGGPGLLKTHIRGLERRFSSSEHALIFRGPTSGGLRPPATLVPGDLTPLISSDSMFKPIHRYMHIYT